MKAVNWSYSQTIEHEVINTQIRRSPNPGNAGSSIVVNRAGELAQLWFGLYNPMGTNNTAELNALYHALRMAMLGAQRKEKKLRRYQGKIDIPTLLKMRAG